MQATRGSVSVDKHVFCEGSLSCDACYNVDGDEDETTTGVVFVICFLEGSANERVVGFLTVEKRFVPFVCLFLERRRRVGRKNRVTYIMVLG